MELNTQAFLFNVHTFKGSSINLGAVTIVSLCTRLENLARTGDLAQISTLTNLLNLEFDKLKAFLAESNLEKVLLEILHRAHLESV
jgi:HPt (histidine-containing phosphotransfer) domain-containing protein